MQNMYNNIHCQLWPAFIFKQIRTMSTEIETLLGPQLLMEADGALQSTSAALAKEDIVLLYFSAHWCPPCKRFTPLLIDFYKIAAQCGVQIVFVSSDRDQASFKEYFATMPWPSLPSDAGGVEVKQNLARLFQVRGIPSLVAIDAKSGKFITGDARTGVMMAGNNKEKQNKLVESWKSKEAVPVEQASLSSGGQEVGKSSILTFLLRNPVYIIGIWYVVRKALGYFEDIGRVGEGGNEL